MAEEQLVIDVVINDAKSASSIGEMKRQVRELQGMLTTLEPDSQAFREAAQEAARLKDEIEDASEAVNNMKGEPVENLKNGFEGLRGKIMSLDFDGVNRSLGAMGSAVSKIKFGDLTKAIGGMIGGLAKLAFAILSNPIFLIAGAIAAAGYALYTFTNIMGNHKTAVEDMYEAQKDILDQGFKLAGQFKTLTDNVANTTQGTEENSAAIEEYNTVAKEQNLILIDANSSLGEQNAIMSINNDLILTRSRLTAAQNQLDANNAEIIKRQLAMQQMGVDSSSIVGKAIQEEIDSYQNANTALLDFIDTEKEGISTAEEISRLRSSNAKKRQEIADMDKKSAKDAEDSAKRASDAWNSANKAADSFYEKLVYNSKSTLEKLKYDYEKDKKYITDSYKSGYLTKEEYQNALKILTEKYVKDEQKIYDDARKKEEKEKEEQAKKDKERQEKLLQDTQELLDKQIEDYEKYQTLRRDNEQLSNAERIQAALNLEELRYQQELLKYKDNLDMQEALKYEHENNVKRITKESEDEQFKIRQENLKKQVDNYSKYTSSIGSLANDMLSFITNISSQDDKKQKKLKKAAFTVNKINSATETGIATAKAVMEAAPNIPLQVLVGIQGAAAVAAILSKRYSEGESGAAETGNLAGTETSTSVATPSATNLYTAGGGTPTTFQSLTGQQNQPNRVYVVESDITNTQNAVAKVQVVSSF